MSKEVEATAQVDDKKVKYNYITFWKRNWKDNLIVMFMFVSVFGIFIFSKYTVSVMKRIEKRDSDINDWKRHYKGDDYDIKIDLNKSIQYTFINTLIAIVISIPYINFVLNMVKNLICWIVL